MQDIRGVFSTGQAVSPSPVASSTLRIASMLNPPVTISCNVSASVTRSRNESRACEEGSSLKEKDQHGDEDLVREITTPRGIPDKVGSGHFLFPHLLRWRRLHEQE